MASRRQEPCHHVGPRLDQESRLGRAHPHRRVAQRARHHRYALWRVLPDGAPTAWRPHDLFLSPNDRDILARSDVVLSLDWPDLQDSMIQARGQSVRGVKIIQVSVDAQVHNGYNGDHQRLPAVDLNIAVLPDAILAPLIANLEGEHRRQAKPSPKLTTPAAPKPELTDELPTLTDIGRAFAYLRN